MSSAAVEEAALQRIVDALAARRVKRTELAARIEVPYRTLQSYLLGKHAMPASTLKKICSELNISSDWVLFGHGALLDYEVTKACIGPIYDFIKMTDSDIKYENLTNHFIDTYNNMYDSQITWRARRIPGPRPQGVDVTRSLWFEDD